MDHAIEILHTLTSPQLLYISVFSACSFFVACSTLLFLACFVLSILLRHAWILQRCRRLAAVKGRLGLRLLFSLLLPLPLCVKLLASPPHFQLLPLPGDPLRQFWHTPELILLFEVLQELQVGAPHVVAASRLLAVLAIARLVGRTVSSACSWLTAILSR